MWDSTITAADDVSPAEVRDRLHARVHGRTHTVDIKNTTETDLVVDVTFRYIDYDTGETETNDRFSSAIDIGAGSTETVSTGLQRKADTDWSVAVSVRS